MWSPAVRQQLDGSGIRVVQTPFQAPNANAYAERFVRSIKEECLNRVIPFGERHLRRTMAEYVEHYHRERNHQGLGNELIDRVPPVAGGGGVRRRQRLGGLLPGPGVKNSSFPFGDQTGWGPNSSFFEI